MVGKVGRIDGWGLMNFAPWVGAGGLVGIVDMPCLVHSPGGVEFLREEFASAN